MDNLFEKLSAKIMCSVCKKICLVNVKTHDVTLFYFENGVVSTPISCSYETVISELCDDNSGETKNAEKNAEKNEQLLRELQLPNIIAALDNAKNGERVDFKFANSPKEKCRVKITSAYFDELKTEIVLAFLDQNNNEREQLELIKKLKRSEDRFDFLRTHICEDFIEVNIQTGECETIHSNSNMVSKNIYKEQIDWFAKNIVAEEERAAYLADFDLDNLLANLRNNDNFYTASYTLVYKDGRHDVSIVNALMQDSSNPDYDYIISFAQDISIIKQQEAQNKQLMEISQHDNLTGLYNRSTAEYAINKHLTEDKSYTPGTLAIIDVDCFKQVNDNYGHVMGDFVLIQLAKTLQSVFRSGDIICRWGGDEFLVFLHNISDEAIIEGRIERLRVRMLACTNKKTQLPITLSIGIAVANPESTIDSLFKLADATLYKVKNQGKNGFLIAHDE